MRSGLACLLVVLVAGCGSGAATPGTTAPVRPTATATRGTPATPSPTAAPATEMPSVVPTPSPAPDPAAMTLEVTGCNGGTVLRWTPSQHPDFHHYVGLRSPRRDIEVQYPPLAPAVDWGDLYASDRFVTTGHDATVLPSRTEWFYRVVAYDAAGRPVSRSNVASGRIRPHRDLGELRAEVLPDGRVELAWEPFSGIADCFSAYRVLHGTDGLAGTLLTSIPDPSRAHLVTGALHPGLTYTLRVQAVRTTTLGHFTLGESSPLTLTVPATP